MQNQVTAAMSRIYGESRISKLKYDTETELVSDICNEKLHGFIRCDLDLEDEEMRWETREFPPIFKRAELSRKVLEKPIPESVCKLVPYLDKTHIGQPKPMCEEARKRNLIRQPQKILVTSYHSRQTVLTTKYVRFLCKRFRVRVSNIQWVLEMKRGKPFTEFVEENTELRRRGDRENRPELGAAG